MQHPRRLIVIGGIMVVLGALLPFLIVIQVLPSTFLLNGIAFVVSVGGLFAGMLGMTSYFDMQGRRDNDWRDY